MTHNPRAEKDKEAMADLVAAYQEAKEHYEECAKETSFARNRECDALNKLNQCQKKIDEAVEGLRWGAPQGSDWRDNRRHARNLKDSP